MTLCDLAKMSFVNSFMLSEKGEAFKATPSAKTFISSKLEAKTFGHCTSWDVYKLKPSGMFKHHSLFFTPTSNPGNGFTAEIRVVYGQVEFWCDVLSPSVSALTYLGSVSRSVSNIISIAIDVAESFGAFHGIFNNCQNYCNLLSDKLQIKQQFTDISLCSLLGLTVAVGYALFRTLHNLSSDVKSVSFVLLVAIAIANAIVPHLFESPDNIQSTPSIPSWGFT